MGLPQVRVKVAGQEGGSTPCNKRPKFSATTVASQTKHREDRLNTDSPDPWGGGGTFKKEKAGHKWRDLKKTMPDFFRKNPAQT